MNIFDLFDKAAKSLQYPRLRYPIDKNNKIVFALAGNKAQFPGTLNITDGGPFGNNIWYGRVKKDYEKKVLHIDWNPKIAVDKDFKEIVRAVISNPVGICSITGQKYSYCCFCGTEITTKESLAVGYGPICAEKWGLPWGQIPLDVGNL